MAVDVFNVTWQNVRDDLPFDGSGINANTPVTPTHITSFIEEGAAQIANRLELDGAGTSLGDNAQADVRAAIKSYAIVRVLDRLGFKGDSRRLHQERWDAAMARYTKDTAVLGTAPQRTQSTVDTDSPRPMHFNRDFSW